MAAWIVRINPGSKSADALPLEPTPFNIRFALELTSDLSQSDARARDPAIERRFQEGKRLLGEKLRAGARSARLAVGTTTPGIATSVPLPRARPVQAGVDSQRGRTIQPDERSLFQKLADLLPARTVLASLTLGDEPQILRSLGFDSVTAVYDISAHTVYLPNGSRLEAHSGYGGLRDNPDRVSERNAGATPPAVYELKPRGQLFHGVPALRMISREASATLGRDGLLAHSYMLGPEGDSNGCVSIKDYDRFLAAYQRGEVVRLAVVPSLTEASRQPLLKS